MRALLLITLPVVVVVVMAGLAKAGSEPEPKPEPEEDRSAWVHPHDMAGPPSQSMASKVKQLQPKLGAKKVKSSTSGRSAPATTAEESMQVRVAQVADCAGTQKKLDSCLRRLKDVQSESSLSGPNCSATVTTDIPQQQQAEEKVFFQRFVRFLINQLPEAETKSYKIEFSLSREDLRPLKQFSQDLPVALSDVDASLTRIVSNVQEVELLEEHNWQTVDDDTFFGWAWMPQMSAFGSVQELSLALIVVLALAFSLRRFSPLKLCILLVLVSFVWHYIFLVKKAVAKKHATLATDIPKHCLPDAQKPWHSYIAASIFGASHKECVQYHETLMVEPFLEVSPIHALCDMFTLLLLHPLEHLGGHLGRFFQGIVSEVSFLALPVVLPFVFIVILVLTCMLCGYKVRSPLMLFSVEPSNLGDVNATEALKTERKLQDALLAQQEELEKLQRMIRHNQAVGHTQYIQHIESITGVEHDSELLHPKSELSPRQRSTCSDAQKYNFAGENPEQDSSECDVQSDLKDRNLLASMHEELRRLRAQLHEEKRKLEDPNLLLRHLQEATSHASPAEAAVSRTPQKKRLIACGDLASPETTTFKFVDTEQEAPMSSESLLEFLAKELEDMPTDLEGNFMPLGDDNVENLPEGEDDSLTQRVLSLFDMKDHNAESSGHK